jgi:hypothetical protein
VEEEAIVFAGQMFVEILLNTNEVLLSIVAISNSASVWSRNYFDDSLAVVIRSLQDIFKSSQFQTRFYGLLDESRK